MQKKMKLLYAMLFSFLVIQTSYSQKIAKKDLLVGKWQISTFTTKENGKLKIYYNGYYTYFHEFKKDGTFISTSYTNDSLYSTTVGKWELNDHDTIRFYDLALVPFQENVISLRLPEKLEKINDTIFITSGMLYIDRSMYTKPKGKPPKTYYRRIE